MAKYDSKWPELLWQAGYTICGGKHEETVATIDENEFQEEPQRSRGCCGFVADDDSTPAGFTKKLSVMLDIKTRVPMPQQSWDDVKNIIENAIKTGKQQKYDLSTYDDIKHILNLENGSLAMMDLLRTGAVSPSYVYYNGQQIKEERLDWRETEEEIKKPWYRLIF